MQCRKCGHVRTRFDPLPDTQCADCGTPYPANEQDSVTLERNSPVRVTSQREETGGRLKWALKLFVIIVVVALVRHWMFPGELAKAAGKQIVAGQQPEVVLYATSWCGYCAKTRRLFKQLRVEYTEYDIEKDETANTRFQKLGGRGVPLIVIGTGVVHGFDEDEILILLEPWLTGVTKT
jgi:glutaredoxin